MYNRSITGANGTIRATAINSSDPPIGANGISGIWYLRESGSPINPPLNADGESYISYVLDKEIDISIGSHKSGTLSFTSNVKQSALLALFPKQFKAGETIFFYRKVGETEWIELPRSFEYNQAGTSAGIATTRAVERDWPGGTNGLIVGNPTGISADPNWLSNIRAFDYSSFGFNGEGVEYAIVISKLQKILNDGGTFSDVSGWIVADDLHYPKCIPWQGSNAAPDDEGDSYEYFRSAETNAPVVDLPVDLTLELYAETPYAEYVNKFYTDRARTVPYTPPEDFPFINFELHADDYDETSALWTTLGTPSGENPPQEINLRWAAGFDSDTGIKVFNSSNSNFGVNAIQTSPLDPSIPPSSITAYATSRIKIIS